MLSKKSGVKGDGGLAERRVMPRVRRDASPPVRGNSRGGMIGWCREQAQRHGLQVLDDGREVELVACAGHPDHQLRVDGGTTYLAVEGLERLVQIGKRNRDEAVHAPQQVTLRDAIFQPELIEQLALIALPPASTVDAHCSDGISVRRHSQDFFDSIGQKLT